MPTVLVVDDSAVDRRLVGGLLRKNPEWTVEYAANGVEALARMRDALPDLIVTDLSMPAMDGLELVRSVRSHYSDVPVILMTAYGSDALAIEALEQGAASYVPKSKLTEKLRDTMEEVLALARADRTYEQLISCLRQCEFTFLLENDPALVDPLVDLVQKMVAGMRMCDFTTRLRIGVALKEALLNALFHGSLEISVEEMQAVGGNLLAENDLSLAEKRRQEPPYCERRVYVDVRITPDEARFIVRDEGPGFDVSALGAPADATWEGECGRGLMLMRSFMDDVIFNPKGNEVTMVKRREESRVAAESGQR